MEAGVPPAVMAALEASFDFYFDPDDAQTVFSPDEPHVVLAIELFTMFRGPLRPLIESVAWAHEQVVHINFDDFLARSTMADLENALRDEPTIVFKALSLSLCGVRAAALPPYTPPAKMTARLQNVRPIRPIREIKADSIDTFMAVRGNVVRSGPVRPLVVAMSFQCCKCRESVTCRFEQGKFEPPARCSATRGCRSMKFEPIRDSAVTVDWQRVKIQEAETDVLDAGRVPRSVDVELTEDLVDSCVPGDVVHVSGMVRSVNADVAAGRSAGRARHLFILYLEAHSIVSAKVSRGGTGDGKQFSERELDLVRTIAGHPDPFGLVVASLCPSIYGNEAVKAALCLGLFGGTHAASAAAMAEAGEADAPGAGASAGASADRFRLSIRGDPHVLIVGDPGLGKSQMLRAVATLSPRGVYVSGNTASGSGLTVTMIRDPDSGDFGLEAGALVLSDQGICCIDEFDKMGKEHQALLEAMEQQRISIAKAGIVASLSARTSVLAAANPVGGHYDRSKTVTENLRMHPALLSRFDLLFIILDRPDEARDRQLSAHVMTLHDRAAAASGAAQARGVGASQASSSSSARGGGGDDDDLDALFATARSGDDDDDGTAAAVPALPASSAALARAIAGRIAEADDRLGSQADGAAAAALAASQAGFRPRSGNARQSYMAAAARAAGGQTTLADALIVGGAGAGEPEGMKAVRETEDIEKRLRRAVRSVDDPVPPVLLRKYVAYARRFCYPTLTPAAALVLQDFYIDLRHKHGDDDTTPITTRQLESMVRLAQARAKVELRETVTRADAVDVVQLMRRSLLDVAMDEMGAVDFSRSVGSGGMSMQRQVKAVVGALNRLARQRGTNRFSRDEIDAVVTEMRLQVSSVTDLIETLNQQSYLLKKGPRQYQLLTSDG